MSELRQHRQHLANYPADEWHEGVLLEKHTPCCGYGGGYSDSYSGGYTEA